MAVRAREDGAAGDGLTMIAILAALALTTAAPPADAAPDDPAANLEQLQQMYDQSCAGREYGAYDDLCDELSHQVRAAQADADRAARRKPVKAHAAQPPKTTSPQPQPSAPSLAPAKPPVDPSGS